MKDPLLEEFKVWLTDNGYERIDSQLNITQSDMFKAYQGGKSTVTTEALDQLLAMQEHRNCLIKNQRVWIGSGVLGSEG